MQRRGRALREGRPRPRVEADAAERRLGAVVLGVLVRDRPPREADAERVRRRRDEDAARAAAQRRDEPGELRQEPALVVGRRGLELDGPRHEPERGLARDRRLDALVRAAVRGRDGRGEALRRAQRLLVDGRVVRRRHEGLGPGRAGRERRHGFRDVRVALGVRVHVPCMIGVGVRGATVSVSCPASTSGANNACFRGVARAETCWWLPQPLFSGRALLGAEFLPVLVCAGLKSWHFGRGPVACPRVEKSLLPSFERKNTSGKDRRKTGGFLPNLAKKPKGCIYSWQRLRRWIRIANSLL